MDNSCKLKLEWIPAAYSAIDKGAKDAPVGKLQQVHPVNGIYKSGNGFAKVYKRKM